MVDGDVGYYEAKGSSNQEVAQTAQIIEENTCVLRCRFFPNAQSTLTNFIFRAPIVHSKLKAAIFHRETLSMKCVPPYTPL